MPELTYREALNQALREEMERDPTVFLLGEDVGLYGGSFKVTEGLLAEFGRQRVLDTPIAEGGIVGLGIGAAMAGLRPVVELMTVNFALLAMDQIVNHAAKIRYMFGGAVKVPIVIRAPEGGGQQLGSQHSQSLDAYFLHCPGLKVVCPGSPADAKGLLKEAIRDDDPVMFLEHEALYGRKGDVPEGPYTVPLGKAKVLKEGKDVVIISSSRMAQLSLAAAQQLDKDGISVEVVDLRCLNPMDVATMIASVKKTGRAVVVEEGWKTGGVGGELASIIMERCFDCLDAPVKRVAGADVPTPYSKNLEKLALPQVENIIASVRELG
ncbi:MAG TPA: pyruvate dehydrogenase complex E1 component subunit beta [Thermodesulfobacteriota bacterium]|nr:pyruvate dehydrogenase complex E1 component subunit beta [Deltaproteobacteria bacterium]HNU70466.1 pyruvate dehydrogenase complex E1 component subunit beta [Thermodesulfobacteriota bacterium]